jgi:ribosome recycling factor
MVNDVIDDVKTRMQTSVDVFNEELRGMRSGRASTAMVEKLIVDYYGQPTELRQLANISTPEALQILIRPYDAGAIKDIERAIKQSDIGVNPNSDGAQIRLNMPPLTRETRQKLVKFLHERAEHAKVSVRNIRRDANKDLQEYEKEKMISEDDQRRGEEQVQKLTDEFSTRIETLTKEKEAEITEV